SSAASGNVCDVRSVSPPGVRGRGIGRRAAVSTVQSAVVTVAQRIVLVPALGAAAVVATLTLADRWLVQPAEGWFMEASSSRVLYSPRPSSGDRIGTALVWVGAVVAWLAVRWRISAQSRTR